MHRLKKTEVHSHLCFQKENGSKKKLDKHRNALISCHKSMYICDEAYLYIELLCIKAYCIVFFSPDIFSCFVFLNLNCFTSRII